MPSISEHPLYNTTYTLYRVSPFHILTPLFTRTTLRTHAHRLGDRLKGEVLRGVYIGASEHDDAILRAGALKKCRWTVLGSSGEGYLKEKSLDGADGWGITTGILIEIMYENQTYTALFLRDATETSKANPTEENLPLLLLRMPAALREHFLSYFSTAFDTRIEPMRLPDRVVGDALEGYLQTVGDEDEGISKLVREVQLSLSFKVEGLKSLEITIKREDVPGFLQTGASLIASGGSERTQGPFMVALKRYLENHLALDMTHKDVVLSRVACAAFALGGEGKVKIFAPLDPEDEDRTQEPLEVVSKNATIGMIKLLLAVAKDVWMSNHAVIQAS